jgi:hypothetical protein
VLQIASDSHRTALRESSSFDSRHSASNRRCPGINAGSYVGGGGAYLVRNCNSASQKLHSAKWPVIARRLVIGSVAIVNESSSSAEGQRRVLEKTGLTERIALSPTNSRSDNAERENVRVASNLYDLYCYRSPHVRSRLYWHIDPSRYGGGGWFGNDVQKDFANLASASSDCVTFFILKSVNLSAHIERQDHWCCVHLQFSFAREVYLAWITPEHSTLWATLDTAEEPLF